MNVKGYSQFPSTTIHNFAITLIDLESFSWRCDEGGNTVDCLMYHYSVKVMKVHKNDGYGGKKLEDLWHLSWCTTRNLVTVSHELQNSA